LLILFYIRWNGTTEELGEFFGRMRNICDKIEDIELKGVYTPTSEWNAVLLFKAIRFEKGIEAYRTYHQKFGAPKISEGKSELLYTFEEKKGYSMTP
jgi:hypothetical protein